MQTTQKPSKYEQQALDFLTSTGTTFEAKRVGYGKYFPDDTDERDIYQITLARPGKKPFIFRFGQSIKDSGTLEASFVASRAFLRSGGFTPRKPEDFERKRKAPSAYDVLACLQKYPVGTLKDFCGDFGYSEDSISAVATYTAVCGEYSELARLYTQAELEQMQEIQ